MEGWLATAGVPLFVSHRRLMRRHRLPVAAAPWALDSGGFTELSMHGQWLTSPDEYVDAVHRYAEQVGKLEWAAPQDWMCEPFVLAKTGRTVEDHQQRTVDSYLTLRQSAPSLPFVPVVQGWTLDEYHRCADLYEQAGVDLATEPTVGIGSVCRRQNEHDIEDICASLAARGLHLHGFGVKTLGMRYARHLASADSMAWSYNARHNPPLPGHTHKSCANCLPWALRWRDRAIRRAATQQPTLWEAIT